MYYSLSDWTNIYPNDEPLSKTVVRKAACSPNARGAFQVYRRVYLPPKIVAKVVPLYL